jgi:hypothetical protein
MLVLDSAGTAILVDGDAWVGQNRKKKPNR